MAVPDHALFLLLRYQSQRVKLLLMGVGLLAAFLTLATHKGGAAEPARSGCKKVSVQLELAGKLRLNGDGSGVVERDLKVLGKLDFADSMIRADDRGRPRQVARQVTQATGEVQVGKWASHPELPDRQRQLVAGWYDGRCRIHSRSAPLTQDERDIVALPCDPLVLDMMTPYDRRPVVGDVRPGDKWTIDNTTAAALMRWDVVSKNTLECVVVRWDEDRRVVLIQLAGELLGAVDGATAEAKLQGKLNYSPTQDQCTWADVRIEELRAIGHAAPGLDVVVRVRVAVTPTSSPGSTELEKLRAEIPPQPAKSAFYLAFHSERHGFELVHAPSWKLMVDGPTTTIFRLVRDGDLIAQANFSRVHSSERPTLADFQQQVRAALAGRIDQIVSADDERRDDGTVVYRVTAAGAVEALPIQWLYVYFRNSKGQAVSCAVTMDARLAERFAGADEELMSGVRVVDLPEPAQASPSRSASAAESGQRR